MVLVRKDLNHIKNRKESPAGETKGKGKTRCAGTRRAGKDPHSVNACKETMHGAKARSEGAPLFPRGTNHLGFSGIIRSALLFSIFYI